MPPNLKQSLNRLIFADCSYRQFLSKQELAYKVLDLPEIRKSFNDVPSVLNFLPADMFPSILRQDLPTGSEIADAYPLNDDFQRRE